MTIRTSLFAILAAGTALPALAEVNIYSYRQPELIQPLMDAFTEKTGIETNVAFLDKGMVERLKAEGDAVARRSDLHDRHLPPGSGRRMPA